jgi:hypothetical protein
MFSPNSYKSVIVVVGLNFNTGMRRLLVVGLWLTVALLIQQSNWKG